MQITVPTTSTKVTDILTQAQKDTLSDMLENRKGDYRIEAHGGTLWWISKGTAVVDECNSILDGDIEFIPRGTDEMEVVASATGVTFNIDIV